MDKAEMIWQLVENPNLNSSFTNSSEDSSDDGHTDLLLFQLILYLTSGRRRSRIENYMVVVDALTDAEFKEHYRITRHTALQLIERLDASGYIPSHTFGMRPISAKLSFMIFLWYIANTEPLRTISDRFDVSISSVFRIIRRVMSWLLTKIDNVIKWPQGDNVIRVCQQFSEKQGLRNVLGAIDCTHVQIEKPSNNARDYCNRKKFFSINLQAVVEANTKFTNIYIGEPGSLHDARVLRRSLLYQAAIENKEMLFPEGTFIIGDSAYASSSWLVPPFRDNGHLTPQQVEFNLMHSSTRMAVERAFGRLKGRFRRIKFFTEYRELSFIINTIASACILHNYCIDRDDEYDFNEYVDPHVESINDLEHRANDDGRAIDRRGQLFLEMFPGQRN